MAATSWAYGSRGHEEEQTEAGQRRQFDGKAVALKALFEDCVPPAVLQGPYAAGPARAMNALESSVTGGYCSVLDCKPLYTVSTVA